MCSHPTVLFILTLATLLPSLYALTCSPGTFKSTPKTGSPNPTCVPCPLNTISTTPNSTSCTRCPPPLAARSTGSNRCTPCGLGKVYNPRPSRSPFVCRNCPANFYNDVLSATSCKPCPPRTFAPRVATSRFSCIRCMRGWHVQKLQRRVACGRCPEGYEAPPSNPLVCTPCPRGYFRNISSVYGCKPCQAGRFNNETGMAYCTKCSPGTYQDREGQTACKKCPPGGVSKLGAKQCRARCGKGEKGCFFCRAGTGLNELTGKCERCAPGMIGQIRSVTGCFQCPSPDAVANADRTKCICSDQGMKLRRDGICTRCKTGFGAVYCIDRERTSDGREVL